MGREREGERVMVMIIFFVCFCSKFMRTECLNSRYVYNRPFPISRLVSAVGNSILKSLTNNHTLGVVFSLTGVYRDAGDNVGLWQAALWSRHASGRIRRTEDSY